MLDFGGVFCPYNYSRGPCSLVAKLKILSLLLAVERHLMGSWRLEWPSPGRCPPSKCWEPDPEKTTQNPSRNSPTWPSKKSDVSVNNSSKLLVNVQVFVRPFSIMSIYNVQFLQVEPFYKNLTPYSITAPDRKKASMTPSHVAADLHRSCRDLAHHMMNLWRFQNPDRLTLVKLPMTAGDCRCVFWGGNQEHH